MTFFFIKSFHFAFMLTQMLIGLAILMIDLPQVLMLFFLVLLSSLGPPRNKSPWLDP